MFRSAFSEVHGVALWWWSGRSNEQDDYERWLAWIVHVDRVTAGRAANILMVVDRENPTAPAIWRQRVAAATARVRGDVLFLLATESVLVRGALTAINWIRPAPFAFDVCRDFDEGVAILGERRKVSAHVLTTLQKSLAQTEPPSA